MNDFGLMCICATRYAIGRRTYVTSAVPEFIINNMNKLNKNDLKILKRDIEEAIRSGNYGDPNIDLPNWNFLLDEINKKISE